MPDPAWLSRVRRVELVVALLLAAVSFAPWWTVRDSGTGASVWTGPYFLWLPVLVCLAIVASRSLAGRWAAGAVVALVAAGWLSHLAEDGTHPDAGSPRMAWVLQDQGAAGGPVGTRFDIAWGFGLGLCLMGLLLVTFAVAALLRRVTA